MTPLHLRKPKRLTITISWVVFERLVERSQKEGRSMSNLSSYLLECMLCDKSETGPQILD